MTNGLNQSLITIKPDIPESRTKCNKIIFYLCPDFPIPDVFIS